MSGNISRCSLFVFVSVSIVSRIGSSIYSQSFHLTIYWYWSCRSLQTKLQRQSRMALFPSTRSLIFPQFETYRLRSLDPSTDLSFSPLPQPGATQSRMGYNQQHLSFKEVRSRIGWDHLSVSGRRGVYIDKVWGVVGFVIQVRLCLFHCLLNFQLTN